MSDDPMNGPKIAIHPAQTFRKVKATASATIGAFEMYVSVWNNRGRGEVMIGAPSLDELEARWEQITSSDFERDRAQRVVVGYAAEFKLENWR